MGTDNNNLFCLKIVVIAKNLTTSPFPLFIGDEGGEVCFQTSP